MPDPVEILQKETFSENYVQVLVVTERLKVPGGWIVRTRQVVTPNSDHASHSVVVQTFVADPSDEWSR